MSKWTGGRCGLSAIVRDMPAFDDDGSIVAGPSSSDGYDEKAALLTPGYTSETLGGASASVGCTSAPPSRVAATGSGSIHRPSRGLYHASCSEYRAEQGTEGACEVATSPDNAPAPAAVLVEKGGKPTRRPQAHSVRSAAAGSKQICQGNGPSPAVAQLHGANSVATPSYRPPVHHSPTSQRSGGSPHAGVGPQRLAVGLPSPSIFPKPWGGATAPGQDRQSYAASQRNKTAFVTSLKSPYPPEDIEWSRQEEELRDRSNRLRPSSLEHGTLYDDDWREAYTARDRAAAAARVAAQARANAEAKADVEAQTKAAAAWAAEERPTAQAQAAVAAAVAAAEEEAADAATEAADAEAAALEAEAEAEAVEAGVHAEAAAEAARSA